MGIYFRKFDRLGLHDVELTRETAKRLTGRTDIGGRLQVTSHAVRYKASRIDGLFRAGQGDWSCPLNKIASVTVDPGGRRRLKGNGPAGIRAKIVSVLQTGEEARIVVSDPNQTCSLIRQARYEAEAR